MKTFLSLVATVSLMTSSALAATDVKIGVVDIQRAIQETAAGKAAKKQLEGDMAKKKEELQKKEADLKKKSEELEKKAAVLSEAQLRKQQGEFQQEMLQFREMVGQSQMGLQRKEQELLQPVIKKMDEVITTLAKNGKYSVILQKSQNNVLWASDAVDITDQVIKAYEKKK